MKYILLFLFAFSTSNLFAIERPIDSQGNGMDGEEVPACRDAVEISEYLLGEECLRHAEGASYTVSNISHTPCRCDYDELFTTWFCEVDSTATCRY